MYIITAALPPKLTDLKQFKATLYCMKYIFYISYNFKQVHGESGYFHSTENKSTVLSTDALLNRPLQSKHNQDISSVFYY